MGKRKTTSVKVKRLLKYPKKLDVTFACPFCSAEHSVDCKIDRARQQGQCKCRLCGAGYQTVVNALSEPVDLYGEWMDAIEARQKAKSAASSA